jgi:hypothetical protein
MCTCLLQEVQPDTNPLQDPSDARGLKVQQPTEGHTPAVTANHPTLKAMLDCFLCNVPQPFARLISVLIHMKIKQKVSILSQIKDSIQKCISVMLACRAVIAGKATFMRAAHRGTQNPPMLRYQVGKLLPSNVIPKVTERHQGHCLEGYLYAYLM